MVITSVSFEVDTPCLCLCCKKIIRSTYIDGKVYVEPHTCAEAEENRHTAESGT